jgi:general secretion pathway protein I
MTSRQDGFTILEALVAFAILSVVLVALYAGASNALRAVDRGSQTHRIALLAQSKLDELAATRRALPSSALGLFAGTNVTWSVQASEVPDTGAGRPAAVLQDVVLTLEWSDGFARHAATFWTRHLGAVRR